MTKSKCFEAGPPPHTLKETGDKPRHTGATKAGEGELNTAGPVLLTGATGYIGGRLLRILQEDGFQVRCLARDPTRLSGRALPATEVVKGDVLDPQSLYQALKGVDTAYYLIHSMGSGGSFEATDRQAALNFARAAEQAGVRRIIYLGGLGDSQTDSLSPHLRSRQQVGEIFRDSGVQTIEFRASVIIGSGSLSFEMVRNLTERLPVMICPRWVLSPSQPIAVSDVLAYLRAALDSDIAEDRIYEIGGRDIVSYMGLMKEYAAQRSLRRLMIPVPVLTPWLSSLWLGLVTPLYARVGRKLVESVRHATVVQNKAALGDFPIRPVGVRQAIAQALLNEDRELAETRWSDALSAGGAQPEWGGVRFGSRLVDAREAHVACSAERAFRPIQRIGGARGYYAWPWLWRLRGWLDLLAGGIGLRRGRRDPDTLSVGDALDFWRVEAFEPGHLLRLRAEMRVPGRAWLQFEVNPSDTGGSRIVQTAMFDPAGLTGLLYWYGLYPVHQPVFAGMLRGIARETGAENVEVKGAQPSTASLVGIAFVLVAVLCGLWRWRQRHNHRER